MSRWQYSLLCIALYIAVVNSAVIPDDVDVDEQGLYSKSDHVNILTGRNFERKVYGKKYAQVVQFYNSYCGHCRAFAPKFKSLASEIVPWKKVIQLSVIDCFNEENNAVCRDFEVMAYPTLRYIHDNYVKGNGNIGDSLRITDTTEKLKVQLVSKMQDEQNSNRLAIAPSLNAKSYISYAQALQDVPTDTAYLFLIYETANSTVGPELILDLSGYPHVIAKWVYGNSELGQTAGIRHLPTVLVVKPSQETLNITPENPSKQNLLKSIRLYLKSQNYHVPVQDSYISDLPSDHDDHTQLPVDSDAVYYSDLEKTLKNILHTEITRFNTIDNVQHQAMIEFLEVLRDNFPYKDNDNLRAFLSDLVANVRSVSNLKGSNLLTLVKNLETRYNPYRTNESTYIGCKGSQPKYRGFTCGLWTLFHSLTVGAASKTNPEGPKVLRGIYGYVKYFFGCTDCSEHFQAMAERNRLFDVKDNDKAVLWLWISHNEVNLRLAGDLTEDPEHPKIQFPSVSQCRECRLARGAWNLPFVYQYLQSIYSSENIKDARRSAPAAQNMFSQLDIGMLSFLYISSFIILILVIRFFLTKRFYRKRFYKHGRGKV